jgi:DnaJ domain
MPRPHGANSTAEQQGRRSRRRSQSPNDAGEVVGAPSAVADGAERWGARPGQKLTLQEAFTLFRRLGVDPQALSRPEFGAAYYRLAWRYHPDRNPNTEELMANINAARSTILQTYLPG